MSELNFKKFSDLDVLENISATSHVVIEEDGDVKRFPANGIGKVKSVNGVEPDENGNVTIEIDGGVSSWNDLTDKPFGEEVALGDTLTWDGNTDGLVSVAGEVYLVSELTPTSDEMPNGLEYTIVKPTGEIDWATFPHEQLEVMYQEGNLIAANGVIISYTDEFTFNGITIPKAGIYFVNVGEVGYVSSLTIPGYGKFETETIKTIDPKYLPGGASSWNDLEDKPFYTGDPVEVELVDINAMAEENGISWYENTDEQAWELHCDTIPAFEVDKQYIIIVNGERYSTVAKACKHPITGEEEICLGDLEDYWNSDFVYYVKGGFDGVFAYKAEQIPTECKIYTVEQEIKKLDTKYLPSGGFGYTEYTTITWDGSIEGKEVYTFQVAEDGEPLKFYKISDEFIPANQFLDATITVSGAEILNLSPKIKVTNDIINEESEDTFSIGFSFPLIFSINNNYIAENELDISEGIYVLLADVEGLSQMGIEASENIFASELVIPKNNKIDEKYLPECAVKTVNGTAPDENGNVAIETSWNNLTDKPTESIDGVEKLKEEIIPDTIARTSDIPTDFSMSWDKLEDKPFGDIVEKEEIFLSLNLPESYSSGSAISSEGSTINTTYPFSNFYVEFNKTSYQCTIEQTSGKYPGQYTLMFGNKKLVYPTFPQDNGMPFCIVCSQPTKTAYVYFRDDIVDHTIEGFTGTPGIKPIEDKFIPDTVARVSDSEEWVFLLKDGTSVTKKVVVSE